MTIRGSLADLDVLELLQTVAAGRKSGELVVAGPEDVARLYFDHGRLCHAETARAQGQDVLAEVVGWEEGEFEFRPDAAPVIRTLHSDLYRALMLALKTRDERRAQQDGQAELRAAPAEDQAIRINARLAEFVAANPAIQQACVIKRRGGKAVPCAASSNSLPAWLDELAGTILALLEHHPRQPVHRVLIEDAGGAVVVAALAGDAALVVTAGPDAPLGAVTLNVRRLALALGEPEALPTESETAIGGRHGNVA